jgi:anti-sigma-K factor RskA
MSEVPWKTAAATGVAVTGVDLLLHVTTWHFGLAAMGNSLSAGMVALFAVAGAGVMLRERSGRAARWARQNPWQFALMPAAATAVIVFVLSIIFGNGLFGDAFTALWHGAIVFGVTGVAGSLAGRKDRR